MGEVFLAFDNELQREVALKVLPEALAEHSDRLARFRREAKAVAQLNHPNIVTIYSIEKAVPDGAERPITFMTMERIKGRLLADLIPRRGLNLKRFFDYALPLTDAVSAAHDQGITHRDLKPDNVMVTRDRRLKVLDFGLAKMIEAPAGSGDPSQAMTATYTDTGNVLGTAPYMSPEQAEGRPLDHRSDIFSLGVMLYEMATGARPFRGDNPATVISAILRDTPPPVTEVRADLPHQLARIIRHCVAKDPGERFQTARDVHTELRDLRDELEAPPTGSVARVGRRGRLPRWAVGLLAFLLVAGLTAAALLYQARDERAPGAAEASRTGPARLAVLPLADLTGGERHAYLAAGITRFLVTQLSGLPEIQVLSHSHVASYGATPQGVNRLVQDSHLDAYLEGHVQADGEGFEVYLNLIDAADGSVAKGMVFAGTADAVFALHDEVIDALSHELAVVVAPANLARLDRQPTTSTDALFQFLEGLALASSGSDPSDMARAESLLRRAVRTDPLFASAHWGLSEVLLRGFQLAGTGPESLAQAEAAARRALQLDDDFDRARMTLAKIYREDGRVAEAIAILEGLVRDQRPLAPLLEALAINYEEVGDLARAEESLERLLAQRPESEAYRSLGASYAEIGDSERALSYFQRAVEVDRTLWLNHNVLGTHYLGQGRYDLARASLERARALAPGEALPIKNLARLELSRFNLSEAIALYEGISAAQLDANTASNLGTAYFYLGTAEALAKAEEYYALAIALQPDSYQLQANLGDLHQRQGRAEAAGAQYAAALALVEEQLEMLPRREPLRLKQPVYLAKLGRCAEAVELAQGLDPDLARTAVNLRGLAQAHALCDSRRRAIELLAEAIPLGYRFDTMRQEDEFAGLRDEPAFQALAEL